MNVKELITQLLDEDMDAVLYVLLGEFKDTGNGEGYSSMDGFNVDTSGRILISSDYSLERYGLTKGVIDSLKDSTRLLEELEGTDADEEGRIKAQVNLNQNYLRSLK